MADTLTILRAAKEIAQQVRGDYMLDGKELEALKASHLALIASMEAQEPVAWLVFDEDGLPEHATIDPQMAQDHINEAIQEFDFMQAAKWTVRPVYLHPAQPSEPKTEPVEKRIAELEAKLSDAEIQIHASMSTCDHFYRLVGEKEAEIERLTKINSDLCRVHNERLIDTVRHEEERDALRQALEKIACFTQTENLLWWQKEARAALECKVAQPKAEPARLTDEQIYSIVISAEAMTPYEFARAIESKIRGDV